MCTMASSNGFQVDAAQVRKAAAALLQYVRKRSKEGKKGKSLLGDNDDDDVNGDFVYVNLALQRVAAHDPKKGMKPRKMYGQISLSLSLSRRSQTLSLSLRDELNDSDTHPQGENSSHACTRIYSCDVHRS